MATTATAIKTAIGRMTKAEVAAFTAVMLQLPEHYQVVIRRTLIGDTQKEIAIRLGISQSRVSVVLRRGLKVIKEVT